MHQTLRGRDEGPDHWLRWEDLIADSRFLSPGEVSERYRGGISVGTLRNWRALRIGQTFVKIGTAVPYPFNELDALRRLHFDSTTAALPALTTINKHLNFSRT